MATRPFTVVINDGAQPSLPNVLNVRTRNTSYGSQNYRFTFERLFDGLPAPLNDLQMDWIELLGAIFAADMACRRGEGDLDWVRSIELFVPLRDPDYWAAYATRVQELFGSLTDDRLALHLVEDETPASPPRQRKQPFAPASSVALLSGGLDSFAGAAALLARDETPPLFLSHSASGAAATAQKKVRAVLGKAKPTEFLLFSADKLLESGFPGDENSQRSRTLLYVGAAALVASALGLADVFINENGVMATHLPLSEARIGSYSTRTASPQILDEMAALSSDALQTPVAVRNLLIDRTKPEVVELAVGLGYGDSIKDTVSCWSIGRSRQHCGICAPCIMRKISCETHGVDDAPYKDLVLDDPLVSDTNARAQDNLIHLCGFVRDFIDRDEFDLEIEYPEVFSGGRQLTPKAALDLHKRWAKQAEEVLRAHPISASLL